MWGLDVLIYPETTQKLGSLPRIHLLKESSVNVAKLGFAPESMDIIIVRSGPLDSSTSVLLLVGA